MAQHPPGPDQCARRRRRRRRRPSTLTLAQDRGTPCSTRILVVPAEASLDRPMVEARGRRETDAADARSATSSQGTYVDIQYSTRTWSGVTRTSGSKEADADAG
jgi:hypothetical protein